MANNNTLPWVIAVLTTAIGAGAIGFFARPYVDGTPAATSQSQVPQQQAPQLPPGTTTEVFSDWTLVCTPAADTTKPPICLAAQDSRSAKGELLLTVLAGYEASGKQALLIRVPLGVQLDQGLIFQMGDEKPAAFAFAACSQVACEAQLIIPDGNFEKFKAAGNFALVYLLADGTPVKSIISMKGLEEAYAKIVKPDPLPAPSPTPAVEGPNGPAATPAPDAPTPSPKPATP